LLRGLNFFEKGIDILTKVCYNKDGGGGPHFIYGIVMLKNFSKKFQKGIDKPPNLCYTIITARDKSPAERRRISHEEHDDRPRTD
jgi:hypothetical protein